MRRLLCLVALVVVPLLFADEKKEKKVKLLPNSLTKKEIAEGWLLLFDGETTFGWQVDGEAKVEKGKLILGGKKPTKASPSAKFPRCRLKMVIDVVGDKYVHFGVPGVRDMAFRNSTLTTFDQSSGKWEGWAAPVHFDIPANTHVVIHYARILPFELQPLFNGKDLKGWNLFKGDNKRQKSTFTVTKEGWLNVKDGPGDLQTEGKYDDFVLQLDCISNGKHLNSGIFFRCLPGEYQMGYEAQIRNQFTDKATQKYSLEEFDPKTNKSTGKKEVLSTAVDYGTGAIYRRMPTRKGLSKDGEWFTMTVVARGRHFATWVNGVQVVDWTDNRPVAKKSARDGYYSKAGPISIQGHDPTTDLSFRNIRIGALPRAKK